MQQPDSAQANPLVSVIIPVYNGERYLTQAIKSVLAQEYRPLEIIVVDDGSTDKSAAVAHGFGPLLRYTYQANAGLGAARNRGVDLSHGALLAFLDADDLWTADSLVLRLAALVEHPELDAVFGQIVQFKSNDDAGAQGSDDISETAPMPAIFAGNMLIRRAAFFSVGAFATKWTLGEFLEWYLRAGEGGLKSLLLDAVVLRRRIHGANMGVLKRDFRGDYLHILKEALDRRSAKAPTPPDL